MTVTMTRADAHQLHLFAKGHRVPARIAAMAGHDRRRARELAGIYIQLSARPVRELPIRPVQER